jgi:predicted ATPase
VLISLEQFELAQARLAEALAVSEETGHRLFGSEIYRLQGELLARQGAPSGEVETNLERAIELARVQQARWFELRATVSLCRWWQAQGKSEMACQELARIYDWFSEGHNSPDLVEARKLLDRLAVPEAARTL